MLPAKKFPAFDETLRFITVFVMAGHLCLSWASLSRCENTKKERNVWARTHVCVCVCVYKVYSLCVQARGS